MHRVYQGTDLTDAEIDHRNRLWWSAYTIELRICVLHGRPNSTLDAYKDASLPLDTGDPARCRERTLIKLLEWLNDFGKVLNTLQRCPPRLRHESLQRVLNSKRGFEKFWEERPVSRTPVMEQCRRSAQLHLYYHLSLVYLCRPFILNRSSARQQPTDGSQPIGPLDVLAEDAVTNACYIIDILAILDSTIGLARGSYIEFSSCRAAGLVVLAASLTNKSETLALKRVLAIQLIQKMALTIAASQSDASLLTAIDASIRRMDNETALSNDNSDDTRAEQARYDTFKKWASNRPGDIEVQHEPVDLGLPVTNGEDPDMQSLFDGFEWNLFDASLFELDDSNVKDLFANFDNWDGIS